MAIRGKKAGAPAVFELRSASMTLVVVALKTTDMAAIERALAERFGAMPEMFNHDPVVIDLAQAQADGFSLDFGRLAELLRGYRMLPAAVRGGTAEQMAAAAEAGLGEAPEALAPPVRAAAPEPIPELELEPEPEPEPEPRAEAPVAAAGEPLAPVATLIVDKPLRSGQQVYARGGDLVVLAAVNNGAEVIADGSIHVYAPLRGKAIAGAKGNTAARIFSTCMEPELIAIAGIYRTTDSPLPDNVTGKPAQIRLDGERLVFEPLG